MCESFLGGEDMTDLTSVINQIKRKQNLTIINDPLPYNGENNVFENFSYFEGINSDNGIDVKVVIYDCSQKDSAFDYNLYTKMLQNEDGISIPITVFKDWDSEMELYFKALDCMSKLSDKRKLTEIFNTKLSMYTSGDEPIHLEPDNEINYDEYKSSNNELEGYVYNISFYELKKIFNVKGRGLFEKNIRNGKSKGTEAEKLRKVFRNYINVFVYNQLLEDLAIRNKEEDNNLKDILTLDEVTLKNYTPENFWFYHNGITIFSYDEEEIDRSGRYITLNPQNISVINGAQTLNNFYMNLKHSEKSLINDLKKFNISSKKIQVILNECCRRTIVKTIIISGKSEYIHPITEGLNTQIPILNEHILANSDSVKELNDFLMEKKMEIIKEGESAKYGIGMGVIEFAKLYLMYKQKPGESKNFKKSGMDEVIAEALEELRDMEKKDTCLNALEILENVNIWWAESKKTRDDLYNNDENEVILNAYGKNYFGSYIIYNKFFDEEIPDFMVLFNKFITDFKNIRSTLSLNDFKRDDLYKDFIKSSPNKGNTSRAVDDIDRKALRNYLNEHIKSQYSLAKVISDYLVEKGIALLNFRVISRSKEKCREAFPFSNSCFTELYTIVDESHDPIEYLEFKESKFFKEIEKEFPVFVLEKEYIKGISIFEVEDVQFIRDFSFKNYINEAKEVYEKTVKAFKKGDDSLFPKVSDNLDFHVRPKAINSDDTFEFTNGEQITKRTFWANKKTVDEIIERKLRELNQIQNT